MPLGCIIGGAVCFTGDKTMSSCSSVRAYTSLSMRWKDTQHALNALFTCTLREQTMERIQKEHLVTRLTVSDTSVPPYCHPSGRLLCAPVVGIRRRSFWSVAGGSNTERCARSNAQDRLVKWSRPQPRASTGGVPVAAAGRSSRPTADGGEWQEGRGEGGRLRKLEVRVVAVEASWRGGSGGSGGGGSSAGVRRSWGWARVAGGAGAGWGHERTAVLVIPRGTDDSRACLLSMYCRAVNLMHC